MVYIAPAFLRSSASANCCPENWWCGSTMSLGATHLLVVRVKVKGEGAEKWGEIVAALLLNRYNEAYERDVLVC